jgi:hypothetical protein
MTPTMSSDAPPVQFPSRDHVVGDARPESHVHAVTAEQMKAGIELVEQIQARRAYKVIGLPAPTTEEVLEARAKVRFWTASRCTAVRDLFVGTDASGSVILTCDKAHHMEIHAHRMTNADGSVTTWRN